MQIAVRSTIVNLFVSRCKMHFSRFFIIFTVAACAQHLAHCISSAEQRSKAEHETKVAELKILKGYDTGHENTKEFAYSTATTDEIQSEIDRVYHELKCSCLFNAQVHMNLTENLLRYGGVLETRTNSIVWYEKIAKRMVNIFLAANNDVPMDEIWMLYCYAYDVESFFMLPLFVEDMPYINDIMTMHDFVVERLEEFTKTECDQGSRFDVKPPEQSEDYPDLWLQAISKNKKTIDSLLLRNAFHNSRVKDLFDYSTLFFNTVPLHDKTINHLLSVFAGPMSWKGTIETLYDANYEARKALGLNSIAYIGTYQCAFVDLLKTIVLQILWRHMLYLNSISAETLSENYMAFILQIKQLLVEFSNLVGLSQDDSIENVIKFFNSHDFTVEDANSVIGDIKQELMVLSKTLNFNVTEPTNLDTATNSKSFDSIKMFANTNLRINCSKLTRHHPINDTILTLDVFVRYLKDKFVKNPVFKTVRSFNKMTKALKQKMGFFTN